MAPAKGLVFVLFLGDDLEVLVESHFELAILALDVVGLVAVGGGVEIVGLDGATDRGTKDCVKRGYKRTGFFEVDTGEERDWTVRLTDPEGEAKSQ